MGFIETVIEELSSRINWMIKHFVELYGDPDAEAPYDDEGAFVASSGRSGGRTSRHGCPYLSMEGHAKVHPQLGKGCRCIEPDNRRTLLLWTFRGLRFQIF